MTKWTNISANFTEDELRIIDHFCEKYKTNRSRVIRTCVRLGLNIVELTEKLQNPNSLLIKMLKPIIKTMFSKNTLKEMEKKIGGMESKIKPEVLKTAVEEVTNLNKDFQAFEKHNPVGAPSQKHGNRGRPKDVGI